MGWNYWVLWLNPGCKKTQLDRFWDYMGFQLLHIK